MSGRASSVHGVKSSGSIIIVVVVSYRKSRTFSGNIYYYRAQSIYGSTIILSSLTSTIVYSIRIRLIMSDDKFACFDENPDLKF